MDEKCYNKKEVEKLVSRAIQLLNREIRLGSYDKEITDNPLILMHVDQAIGDMENAIEWVFDEIEEEKWDVNKSTYYPIT